MFGLNPYLIGGVAAAFIALGATAGWYAWDAADERADRIAAEAESARLRGQLQQAVAVNKENVAALDEIKAQQKKAEEIATKLAEELQVSTDSQLALATKLAALRNDPDAKSFLDAPLPDAILRLYADDPKAGSDRPDQAGQAGRAGAP